MSQEVLHPAQVPAGGGGAPTGPAGGDLAGTYPDPTIGDEVIVDQYVSPLCKDGIVTRPSMRTLGAGALQAAPGDHTHAASITINQRRANITFTLGDATNAIDTSEPEQWLECNFDGTIEGWSLLADVSGNLVVDVWKDVFASYPPVVGDSICASAKPTLSGAVSAQSSTLTGWTTAITRGDILKVHVDSAATLKRAVLSLRVVKT